jgi:hypothetical protein
VVVRLCRTPPRWSSPDPEERFLFRRVVT